VYPLHICKALYFDTSGNSDKPNEGKEQAAVKQDTSVLESTPEYVSFMSQFEQESTFTMLPLDEQRKEKGVKKEEGGEPRKTKEKQVAPLMQALLKDVESKEKDQVDGGYDKRRGKKNKMNKHSEKVNGHLQAFDG